MQLVMSSILRNSLALLAGLILGSAVNMSLINISGSIIPPPEGFDLTTEAGLKASMPFLEPKHFIFPFLAHALGTLSGAFLAALIAVNNQLKLALVIGFVFLFGGIWMVCILPAPMWFNVIDLVFAYIPCAWLGARLIERLKKQ
jgi:hypothetical protein